MQKLSLKDLKFALPERKYCRKEKRAASVRLPADLIEALQDVADEFGWDKTEVMTVALDQFCQWAKAYNRD